MFVAVNGVRLFFDVLNSQLELTADGLRERPTLLCLHGGPGADHMTLRPEIDALAPHAQILLLDQRGGGRSDAGSPSGWTLDQWADDAAALCAVLGVSKPVVLGNSAGTMVALRLATRHPDLASGLVLASPALRFDREARIAEFARRGGPDAGAAARGVFERGAPGDFAAFFRLCLPLYNRRPLPDAQGRIARSRGSREVSRAFFGPDGPAWTLDLAADLALIRCPTLAISGAHDPITPSDMAREVAEGVPNRKGRFVVFEDASHTVMTDEPERFVAVVADFIARL